MDIISKIFSRSPFPSLSLQAKSIQAYLVRIEPLSWAIRSAEADEAERIRAELRQILSDEHRLAEEVRDILAGGQLLPVRRERLIAVANATQSVLETGQELVELLQRRSLTLPEEFREQFDLTRRLAIQAACLAAELVRRLKVLPQVGCDGPEIDKLRVLLNDVDASGSQCDEVSDGVELQMSQHEKSIRPSDFVHGEQVIGQVGRLASSAKRLAHGVHLLVGGRPATSTPFADERRDADPNLRREPRPSGSPDEALDRRPAGDELEPVAASARDSWSS